MRGRDLIRAASCGSAVLLGAACVSPVDAVATLQSPPDSGAPSDGGRAPTSGTGQSGLCLGQLAASTFQRALCACNDLSVGGSLITDSFDSRSGPYSPGSALSGQSHVGVVHRLSAGGQVVIGGDLRVGSDLGAGMLPRLATSLDLEVAGALSHTEDLLVGQDLRLTGNLQSSAALRVLRDLHQPSGAMRTGSGPISIGGRDLREPVALSTPCPCAVQELIDIAGIVLAVKQNNDNLSAGFDPASIEKVIGDLRIELGSGRLWLSSIDVLGKLSLVVNGRTALLVSDYISVAGGLELELGPDGELDLFVGGLVSVADLLTPGSVARPARLRIYVGGSYFFSQSFAKANLYAPQASVLLVGPAIEGSIFARDITTLRELAVHHDRSIAEEDGSCDWFPLTAAP